MDENCQKLITISNIKIFKSEHYFQYSKNILTLLQPINLINDKIKIYNLDLEYSITKRIKINYWNLIYKYLLTSSDTELSTIIDKYLQSYAKNIYKKLIQLSSKYKLDIDKLKQEYLNLCQIKISSKFKKSIFLSPERNLLILNKKNKTLKSHKIFANDITKKYYTPKPTNSIERELYKIKHKAFKEIISEYIGNVNVGSLLKRKEEIQCMYFRKFGPKFEEYKNKLFYKSKYKNDYLANNNSNQKTIKRNDFKNIKVLKLNNCTNFKSSDNIFENACFSEFNSNKRSNLRSKNNKLDKNITFIPNKILKKSMSYNNKYNKKVCFSMPLLKEKFGINNRYGINGYKPKNIINKKYFINSKDFFY